MSEAPALKTGPGLHVITRTLGGVYDNTHPECARAVHPVRTHPTNGEPCTHPRRRRFSVSIRAADPSFGGGVFPPSVGNTKLGMFADEFGESDELVALGLQVLYDLFNTVGSRGVDVVHQHDFSWLGS